MGTVRSPKAVIGDQATSFEASILEQLVGHTVAEIERELIIKTLDHFEGNRTRASVALGISVRCLRNKIYQFKAQGIDVPEPHPGPMHQRNESYGGPNGPWQTPCSFDHRVGAGEQQRRHGDTERHVGAGGSMRTSEALRRQIEWPVHQVALRGSGSWKCGDRGSSSWDFALPPWYACQRCRAVGAAKLARCRTASER